MPCLATRVGGVLKRRRRLLRHCAVSINTASPRDKPTQSTRGNPGAAFQQSLSRCRSGSAATWQRSADCSTSSTVISPTTARSVFSRLRGVPVTHRSPARAGRRRPLIRECAWVCQARTLGHAVEWRRCFAQHRCKRQRCRISSWRRLAWLCLIAPPHD